ncbi:hypothetical protein B0H14DRAFT_3506382 [Mycena olivaceomarginata]|nr:hypothetical protein B0H14DRAFT_3506382 [Mycena olivaceomarginata]
MDFPPRARWPNVGANMCSSWLPQHDVLRTFRYSWWSQIGVDAEKEMAELRAPFNAKYPWHTPTPKFLADRAALQARLACSYAIVSIREHIQDAEFLAARADIDAVLELMTDAFVHAWGPRFSPRTRVRRARRLARQEELEAAQAAAAAATTAAPMDIDDNASAWVNSGWGDGSGWSDGSGWGSGSGWGGWGTGALPLNATTVQFNPPPLVRRRCTPTPNARVGAWVTVSAGPATSARSTSSSAVTSAGEASVAAASSAPGITLPAILLFELVWFCTFVYLKLIHCCARSAE